MLTGILCCRNFTYGLTNGFVFIHHLKRAKRGEIETRDVGSGQENRRM